MEIVYTAAQGFTFEPGSAAEVITAQERGMGALYGNGYTEAAEDIGTPVISDDGSTVTLTVGSMPAGSAIAFNATPVMDDSGQALVIDETMVGTGDATDDGSAPGDPAQPGDPQTPGVVQTDGTGPPVGTPVALAVLGGTGALLAAAGVLITRRRADARH